MKIIRVWAVYFSATGTTEKVVSTVALNAAKELGAAYGVFDFTLPGSRTEVLQFGQEDLVILGTPVYAGRVPNILLKFLATIEGHGAMAIPIVVYGNRNYDDALIELRDILEKGGFHTISAAAFIGEHSFSYRLAKGRPDSRDMAVAEKFGIRIAQKFNGISHKQWNPIFVKGRAYPYRGYYQPLDAQGNPVDLRKVKPLTKDHCNDCKICVKVCPMGSIDDDHVWEVRGICIKCGACIKKCPIHGKYFVDQAYLYHKEELELSLTRRAEPELFI